MSQSLEMRTFPHAMLREIYEQPDALAATIRNYVSDGSLNPEAFAAVAEALRGHQRVVIAASGSSRHAGLAGEIMLEDLAGLTVDVEYASEYCYRSTHTLQDPGLIVISQSGPNPPHAPPPAGRQNSRPLHPCPHQQPCPPHGSRSRRVAANVCGQRKSR